MDLLRAQLAETRRRANLPKATKHRTLTRHAREATANRRAAHRLLLQLHAADAARPQPIDTPLACLARLAAIGDHDPDANYRLACALLEQIGPDPHAARHVTDLLAGLDASDTTPDTRALDDSRGLSF